jgi:hypothetical protein
MADPVSWLMIRKGWRLVSADGSELGIVEEVAGDDEADIFDGLSVRPHLFEGKRFVPAEAVSGITQGVVATRLTHEQFGQLSEFQEPPPSLEIEPETAPRSTRMLGSLRGLFGRRRRP